MGIAHAIVVGGNGKRKVILWLTLDRKDLTPTTRIKGEVNKQGWRKMTPREWARLQGYPDDFKIVVADASAYKQFGNSVAVPAIQATASQLLKTLNEHGYIREIKASGARFILSSNLLVKEKSMLVMPTWTSWNCNILSLTYLVRKARSTNTSLMLTNTSLWGIDEGWQWVCAHINEQVLGGIF